MLVLTRRKNEIVQIGDNIRLQVVSVSRRSVKLAFDAPREVPINRGEVQQRIESEQSTPINAVGLVAKGDESLSI